MKYFYIILAFIALPACGSVGMASPDGHDEQDLVEVEDQLEGDSPDTQADETSEADPDTWTEPDPEVLEEEPAPDISDTAPDPDVPEEPTCGPTDDCDGDGLSPLGGDCCDSDPRVHPMQPGWFYAPYACPGPSWDYDCSGGEEYEQEGLRDGIDASVGTGCLHYSYSDCLARPEGWVDGPPACGEIEVYVTCIGESGPGWSHCATHSTFFNGLMGCH